MSLSDIVAGTSLKVAGDEMDAAIVDYMKRHFSLKIGMQTAEKLKIGLGNAYPLEQELTHDVRGLDTISGVPRKAMVTSEEIRQALLDPLEKIIAGVKNVIEQCDPELVSDLVDNGLVLTGGGALLRGIDSLMNEQLGIPVRVIDDPLTTVARGTAICVEHLAKWRESLDAGDE